METILPTGLKLAFEPVPGPELARPAWYTPDCTAAYQAYYGNDRACSSGFSTVDRINRGVSPGTLAVWAAETGLGKTTFALNAAYRWAGEGRSVGYFTAEDPPERLLLHVIELRGGPTVRDMRLRQIGQAELVRMQEVTEEITRAKVRFASVSCVPYPDVLAQMRHAMQHDGCDVLIVDHIHQLSWAGWDNRTAMLDGLAQDFMDLASRMHGVVIAIAQFNRSMYDRGRKRPPTMSDLKGSGQLEHTAKQVILMHAEQDTGRIIGYVAKDSYGEAGGLRFLVRRDGMAMWDEELQEVTDDPDF